MKTNTVRILDGEYIGQKAYVTNRFPEEGLLDVTPVVGDPLTSLQLRYDQVVFLCDYEGCEKHSSRKLTIIIMYSTTKLAAESDVELYSCLLHATLDRAKEVLTQDVKTHLDNLFTERNIPLPDWNLSYAYFKRH